MNTVAWAAAAAGAFSATNLDNLVALTAQLAGWTVRDRRARVLRQALCGQYLALLVLLAVSGLAAVGLLQLPPRAAALAGLVPLGLGLYRLRRVGAAPGLGRRGGRPSTWAVALLSVGCGVDNVAVYGPLFAQATPADAVLAGAVFAALVPPMCALAGWLARRAVRTAGLRAVGDRALPACLIAVGLLVLRGAVV